MILHDLKDVGMVQYWEKYDFHFLRKSSHDCSINGKFAMCAQLVQVDRMRQPSKWPKEKEYRACFADRRVKPVLERR